MIKLKWIEDRICPMFICDQCGDVIYRQGHEGRSWKDRGHTIHAYEDKDENGVTAKVLTVHQRCLDRWEHENGRYEMSGFLDDEVHFAINNFGGVPPRPWGYDE